MTKAARFNWKLRNRAFSLVELMIVVAIIGVLSTIAIQGVRRYLANAKSAEAKMQIGRIAKSAVISFDQDRFATTGVMIAGATVAITRQFCATAASVPAALTSVKGVKYQSSPSDWAGDTNTGWRCLRFTLDSPQAFQYVYAATVTAGAGDFTASAFGDLNGDGTTSSFVMSGAASDSVPRYSPSITETSPDE